MLGDLLFGGWGGGKGWGGKGGWYGGKDDKGGGKGGGWDDVVDPGGVGNDYSKRSYYSIVRFRLANVLKTMLSLVVNGIIRYAPAPIPNDHLKRQLDGDVVSRFRAGSTYDALIVTEKQTRL